MLTQTLQITKASLCHSRFSGVKQSMAKEFDKRNAFIVFELIFVQSIKRKNK